MRRAHARLRIFSWVAFGALLLGACNDEECVPSRCGGSCGVVARCPAGSIDGDGAIIANEGWGGGGAPAVCDPGSGPFTLDADNEYFPLVVGSLRVMEGEEDGARRRVELRVLDDTQEVAGITTRVIEEREYKDHELVEVSRNWFAQASDRSICYFGAEVDTYEDGQIVAHEGAWRAGVNGARAGIAMPGVPVLGMSYARAIAPDDGAWDHAVHVAEGVTMTVPADTFEDVIQTLEWTPLEPDEQTRKAYAPSVGMIVDDAVQLVSYEE